MKDNLACVKDILKYARRLRDHVGGRTFADFMAEDWMQDAAFRCLEIMGEAVKRLSPEFRAAHPTIPWKEAAGFRDVLAHGYDELDYELCWKIIQENVPLFVTQLEAIVPPPQTSWS